MSRLDEFLSDYKHKATDVMFSLRETLLTKAVSVSSNKWIDDGMTHDDYVDLFARLRISTVNSFRGYKVACLVYLDWLIEHGYIDDGKKYRKELTNLKFSDLPKSIIYSDQYFRNATELSDAIRDKFAASGFSDWMYYGTVITSLYLAWCGLTIDEAVDVKRDDVREDSIIFNGIKYHVQPDAIAVIKAYMDADGYNLENSLGLFRRYKKSAYLLRTYISPHVSPGSLRTSISDFNKVGGEKSLSYTKVYVSGLYNRAYQWEIANGELKPSDLETMSKVFHDDFRSIQTASTMFMDYKNFKEYLQMK